MKVLINGLIVSVKFDDDEVENDDALMEQTREGFNLKKIADGAVEVNGELTWRTRRGWRWRLERATAASMAEMRN